MSQLRVVVLGGGRSSEHEISLASAASVAEGLQQAGHDARVVVIGHDGVWRENDEDISLVPGRGMADADVVFPALHGPFGEDGTVQGLLDSLSVPYVGAGVLASALCMDKITFKEVMARAGMPQVDYRGLWLEDFENDRQQTLDSAASLGLPVFVKPARLGSSVGIVKVTQQETLPSALENAFHHDPRVIVEAAAGGLEVECSVLGNRDPIASEPGEIALQAGDAGWYDYDAKYTPGGMELVVPARISETARGRVRDLAVEAFRRAGCAGLARVDFFVDGEEVLLNELNTIPGFTTTSVFSSLFAATGIEYQDLLDRLLRLGLERYEEEARFRF